MLPGMKKVWANVSSGHPQLAAILYDEKHVSEMIQKWMDAQKQASASHREWAKVENDKLLKDLFTALEEANNLSARVYSNFVDKHNQYRKVFKDILQDKLMFDDMKKQTDQLDNRVQKMFKSYENVQKKKNNPCRMSMAHEELKKALKAKEEFHVALDNRLDEINLQTLQRVRHNLFDLMDASSDLHRKMLVSLEEQRRLVSLYLPDNSMANYPNLTKAEVSVDKILTSLTDKLKIPRPLSRSDIYAGVSFQAFRYMPDKDLVLSPAAVANPNGDAEDRLRPRSNTLGDELAQSQVKRASRLPSEEEYSSHHLKPLPPPRPAFSLTDLRDVGTDDYVTTDLVFDNDSDDDYQYTGPYLSLVKEQEEDISPSDASNLYEKMADWLSKQSPRSSLNQDEPPPPVPTRSFRGKPPKPPVKPKDIHKRLEMCRQRSMSTGTLDLLSSDDYPLEKPKS